MPRSRSRSHRRSRKAHRPSSSSSSSRSSAHSRKRSHSREHKEEGRRGKRSIDKLYKSPFANSELVISSVFAGPALTKLITAAFSSVVDIDKTKLTKAKEDIGNMKLLLVPRNKD